MPDLEAKDDVDGPSSSDKHGLQQLEKWLKDANETINSSMILKTGSALKMLDVLTQLDIEAGQLEDLQKAISKKSTQHRQVYMKKFRNPIDK